MEQRVIQYYTEYGFISVIFRTIFTIAFPWTFLATRPAVGHGYKMTEPLTLKFYLHRISTRMYFQTSYVYQMIVKKRYFMTKIDGFLFDDISEVGYTVKPCSNGHNSWWKFQLPRAWTRTIMHCHWLWCSLDMFQFDMIVDDSFYRLYGWVIVNDSFYGKQLCQRWAQAEIAKGKMTTVVVKTSQNVS